MNDIQVKSFTRGKNSWVDDFLANKRTSKANQLIADSYRKGRVLDIGCGTYPLFLFSTDFKEKYGIDPSLSALAMKEKRAKLKKTKLSNHRLDFESNFFDVVTMLAVFEHIDEKYLANILSESHRILKSGGLFIVTTPAPWSDKVLHFTAKMGIISKEEIHDHKHNHSMREIVSTFEKAGFERNKISSGYFELGFNMWFCAKK